MGSYYAQVAQALLDAHAQLTGRVEALTYIAKATPTGTPVEYAIEEALWGTYRLSALSPETILPTDQECKIPTAAVAWTPSDYDEILRADGTRWRVIGPITGGRGYPFYALPVRQIG